MPVVVYEVGNDVGLGKNSEISPVLIYKLSRSVCASDLIA